jgi:hypothetical protein
MAFPKITRRSVLAIAGGSSVALTTRTEGNKPMSAPTGILFNNPLPEPLSTSGQPMTGAYYIFYLTGTTTPANVYYDGLLTTPLSQTPGAAQPSCTANSAGQFNAIYLNPSTIYRVQLFSSLDVKLEDNDPYVPTGQLTAAGIGATLYPQTAAEVTASVTPTNYQYAPGVVDRYGTNTTPGTTSMVAAFNAAVAQCEQVGGAIVTYGATGLYLLDSPVNCTFTGRGNQQGVTIRQVQGSSLDQGHGILAKHTGVAVFDCTGCDHFVAHDVTIRTDHSTYPQTGILWARNAVGSSQFNRMYNCSINGSFSVACLYNYASEDCELVGCYFANYATTDNTCCVSITASNIMRLTSPYTRIYSGSISCSDMQFFGGQFYNVAGNTHSDVVRLEQAQYVRFFAPWMANAGASTGGRAYFYHDTTNNSSNFIGIYSLYTEASAHIPSYGVFFGPIVPANSPTCWNLENCAWFLTSYAVIAAAGQTIDRWQIRGNQETNATNGINIPGTAQGCTFDNSSVPLIIGTSANNTLIGKSEDWAITTRSNDSWIDSGTTNKSFAPGVVSGSNGWTAVGAITQTGKGALNGATATVQIFISGATSIACTDVATIALPAAFKPAATSYGQVFDATSNTVIGVCEFTGTGITIRTAVTPTADTIYITGTYFVA